MKIPRDISGQVLVSALRRLGYATVRQSGSHIRLTTAIGGQHHITVPNHFPIKTGTLTSILKTVATHHKLSVEQVIAEIGL